MIRNKLFSTIISIVLLIFAAACIISLITLFSAGVRQDILNKKSSPSPLYEVVLDRTFDYGDGYVKQIIFIGDRTVAELGNSYPAISKYQIWTGADQTLSLDFNLPTVNVTYRDGKSAPIPTAAKDCLPKYMIVTLGIENGVGYCTKEKFKEYYSSLISAIKEASPDTKIILQSILPVSKAVEKSDPKLSNGRISEANQWIKEICNENNLKYLNTHSALTNDNGFLDQKYDSGDGITLNDEGYKLMINYIRTHGFYK